MQTFQSNLRSDGRTLEEFRKATIDFGELSGTADSSQCYVAFGDAQALATAFAEIVVPYPDRPNEGLFTITTTISPMCGDDADFGRNKRSKEQAKVGAMLEQALKDTKALDTESLCIVAGVKVWSVRIDVHITNYAGNMIDTACLAALGALVRFRRPEVTVVGETVTVHSVEDREPVPLAIHHLPLCVTFGFYRTHSKAQSQSPSAVQPESESISAGMEQMYVVADPTDREERVLQGTFTVVVNGHGEVCGIHKQGWPPVGAEEIQYCIKAAERKSKELAALINA